MDNLGFDWLKERSKLTPDKIALIDLRQNLRLTYKETNCRANIISAFLLSKGISKGDRIAIISPNDLAFFDLIFACSKSGAIFVPFNTRFSKTEINYLLEDSKPKILFIHSDYLSLLKEIAVNWLEIVIIDTDFNKRGENKYTSYTEILQGSVEKINDTALKLNDPWMIIYTGGTTNFPKGAVLSYRSVIWNSINTIISWGIGEYEITVNYMPLFHTGGINALSLPILHMGGTVVIGRQFDPVETVNIIEKEKCTIILLVPTMYHMLIRTEAFQQAEFASMHTFLSGGASCPLTIYDVFHNRGLNFKEGYGLTEAGPNNFYIEPDHVKEKKGSVGKPMFYNQVKIVGESGNDVGLNDVGEIWLKGPHLFEYYWNKEKETAEAFNDQWFKTGDLGKKDKDGYHYIVGRKKDMIISGGENIYPLEIENILQQHPAVNEVAVIGLPDEKWGEIVTAVISINDKKTSINETLLKEYLIDKIARYKIPKKIYILEQLPKTSVGKIAKTELVKQFKK